MNSAALTSLTASYAWSIAQVTLFAAAALVVYAFARRQSSHHNVLLLTASLAIAAVLTLSFLSPWPSWNLADKWTDWTAAKPPQVFRVSHYEQRTTTTVPLVAGDSSAAKQSTTTRTIPVLVPITHERSKSTKPAAPLPWLRLALAASALLTFVGIGRFLIGLFAVHRHRQSSVPIDDTDLEREFNSLAHQFKITRPVALRIAPTLAIPATIGSLRPLVLVPQSFLDWSADERRAVLAHELAHIAERHYPLWLVAQFAVAANFYHPLIHWLGRRLRLEQELAADTLALQVFTDRRAYAHILAGLALAPARSHTATASLGLYMSRPLLMRRIAMLRQNTVAHRQSRFANVFAAVLLVLVTLLAIGLRAPKEATASEDRPEVQATPIPDAIPVASPVDVAIATVPGLDNPKIVTALFQVSRNPANALSGESRSNSDKEWEIFCKTQLAFVKSYFVLEAALNDPKVKDLSLIKSRPNPFDLLDGYLHVGFVNDSEIMYISMSGATDDVEQRRVIVDAVANAYMNEVVFAEDQRRGFVRDTMQNSYAKLTAEIAAKMEEQQSLARELGAADQDGRSRILQELDIKRLDRIETELLRLEDEQLAAKTYADELRGDVQPKESAKLKFYEQRITDLEKRRTELEERIIERNQSSVELATISAELKQLQDVANGMCLRIEQMDIESAAPNRIRQIQKAM